MYENDFAARNEEVPILSGLFTFHTDAGHAWVEVDLHQMRVAGLEPEDFSRCSYRKRNIFYLEEDCDAPKFIDAWQRSTGQRVEFRESYGGCRSFIRGLPRIHD